MTVRLVPPSELYQRKREGEVIDLIDVRTPLEYSEIHAEGARSVPLDTLVPGDYAERRSGNPLYVICHSGSRAAKACEKLRTAGVEQVYSVEGGTLAWEKAGLPVVRGQKVMSLERQVRMTAGLLVLLGVAAGWFVHPAFLGLAAFVGAGLLFSGVTDTCGMGLLLARMPWNRTPPPGNSCPV